MNPLPGRSVFSTLTEWLIRKRYFVVFALAAVLGLGFIAYQNLPLEAFPDVANMQARVITQVPGKAPEEVERLVTIPLEKEINGIPHSKPPRSISIFGLSVITIVFDDDADPYSARQQVLERVSHAELPDGITPELDPNASPVGEIFRYTLQGKHWSPMDKKEVQEWLLNRLFRSVDGIVDSTGFGGPTKIFLVELDPGRLRALGISQEQVADAISKSNDSTGGSYIVNNDQRWMVRGLGLLKSVADIENVVIASSSEGVPIRVKDLAHVEINVAVRKGQVGLNDDDDAVEGILMMRRGDNPSRVIENLNQVWQDAQAQLPEGLHLEPLYDRTKLVKRTVETIRHNVLEGIGLVVLILMIFLFQVRGALVCSLVIPTALLTACIVLRAFNIPANLLSLGAIDFGIIVDGAVVMVESIARRVGMDKPTNAASMRRSICAAVGDVAKPILFGTTIIAMTFLPILSFEHVEGRLFKPLAVMMNLNLVAACLATILVVPVLYYLVSPKKPRPPKESPVVVLMEHVYQKVIPAMQRFSKLVIIGFICLFLTAGWLTPQLGAEFIPELEEGNIWLTVTILPPSVTLEKSVEIARKLRSILKTYPEAKNTLTQIGSPDDGTDPNPYNLIEVLVDLQPQDQWRSKFKTKDELIDSLDEEFNREVPGIICNFSQCIKDSMEEAMSGVKNGEFSIKITGPDLPVLESLGDKVAGVMRTVPGIEDVAHDLLLGQPQLTIEIDRDRAARFGVTADEILDIVETAIGGKTITKVIQGERRFDLVLRYLKNYRQDPHHVEEILVTTPAGLKIPLKQLATIKEAEGANSICREGNKRRMAVYANIRGRDLGSAVTEVQNKVEALTLPAGYQLTYAGEFERAREALGRLLIVVPVTILLIFTLLYFAFDSAALSLLVMSAVPVAGAVAVIVLFFSGTHLSISSGVGLIALFGLSVQNAVIIVSKIKDLIASGCPPELAVRQAAVNKLNAVVIAALVAAVGLAPAALSNGIGSQSQKPFAIVIACGILPSTVLTLLLLPALGKTLVKRRRDEDEEDEATMRPLPVEDVLVEPENAHANKNV